MQRIDYADEATEKLKIGKLLSNAGLGIVTELANAKKEGKKLPKFLDKIAGVAIKGEASGKEMVKEKVMQEIKLKLPWIVAGVIALILVIVLIKRR